MSSKEIHSTNNRYIVQTIVYIYRERERERKRGRERGGGREREIERKCWDGFYFSFPSCHYMLPM
jgi:hypothetical protein